MLADKLRQYPVEGGIADAETRVGAYVALFSERPFYGGPPDASPDNFCASGAKLVTVRRLSPLAMLLDHDRRFENLDAALRLPGAAGRAFDLQVYGIRSVRSPAANSTLNRLSGRNAQPAAPPPAIASRLTPHRGA